MASLSNSNLKAPLPFSTVAWAGHTLIGGYSCTCGCPECECDAGETPANCQQANAPVSPKLDSSDEVGLVNEAPDLDLTTGAMILALAFFVWARLRL